VLRGTIGVRSGRCRVDTLNGVPTERWLSCTRAREGDEWGRDDQGIRFVAAAAPSLAGEADGVRAGGGPPAPGLGCRGIFVIAPPTASAGGGRYFVPKILSPASPRPGMM
jgi:hypothetical protein